MWIETSKGMVNMDHLALVKWSLTSATADGHGELVATLDLFRADGGRLLTLEEPEGQAFLKMWRHEDWLFLAAPDCLKPDAK